MAGAANEGKALETVIDGASYQRIPIRTHVVMPGEKLDDVVSKYAVGEVREGDLLFITEKIVAIMQGRSYMMEDIRPRKLAVFLSKYVTRTAFGIGLGIPETMEFAIREVGAPRILFAAAVSVVSKKILRRSGDFYRIAGDKARAIDGPTPHTIPPYNNAVVLGPEKPKQVAADMKRLVGCDVAVVDINDLGGNILGSTLDKAGEQRLLKILQDNPLGQGHESTPMGIIRKA
ncbi:coenzyme F420-0:L-glutamate ligase [Microbacterium halophytorum]|uniref:coenzyme F420-0:L-glutamate ligase n=1 Tax=Microbacterium halophytorum TaxID=2067568 RepID=UPI000CFAD393|nr:coenzyme F420-0:L-glutamate ligase [Microbacterium halophytorum]